MPVTAPPAANTWRPSYSSLAVRSIDARATGLVGEDLARALRIIPLSIDSDALVLAVCDPGANSIVEDVRSASGRPVSLVISTWPEIEIALDELFRPDSRAETVSRHLGELLLEIGFVRRDHYHEACRITAADHQPLDQVLVERSFLDEESIAEAKGLLFGLPWVRLDSYRVNTFLAPVLPVELARQLEAAPLFVEDGALVIASPDLLTRSQMEDLQRQTGLPVRQVISTRSGTKTAIQEAYPLQEPAPKPRTVPFDQVIVDQGLVTPQDLWRARAIRMGTGEPLEAVLRRLGYLDDHKALKAQASQLGVQHVRLRSRSLHAGLALLLPESISRRYACLPFDRTGGNVSIAMLNPLDKESVQVLGELVEAPITPFLCLADDLEKARAILYAQRDDRDPGKTNKNFAGSAEELHELDQDETNGTASLSFFQRERVRRSVTWIELERYNLWPETVLLVPEETAKERCLVPVRVQDGVLTLAMADPTDLLSVALVEDCTGLTAKVVMASRQAIENAIEKEYAAAAIDVGQSIRDFTNHLVQQGVLEQRQVREVWAACARGDAIDLALTGPGLLTSEQVALALAEYRGLEYLDLTPSMELVKVFDAVGQPSHNVRRVDPVDRDVARLLSAETAKAIMALPISSSNKPADRIVVAFANPLDEAAIEAVGVLSRPFIPVVSTRDQLLDAIRRSLGRTSVGDHLVSAGIITPKQQAEAVDLHRKTGVRIGKTLVSLGYITDEQLSTLLAEQQQIAFYDLADMGIDAETVRMMPEEFEREHRLIPIERDSDTVTVAVVDALERDTIQAAEKLTGLRVHCVLTTEESFTRIMEDVYRKDYLNRSATELIFRYPDESAYQVLSAAQKAVMLVFLGASALFVAWNFLLYFLILNSLATLFYVSSSIYKLYLIYRSLTHTLEIPIDDEDVSSLDERDLPVYSILIPLYRESAVVPKLVRGIDRLDYPKAKLDVKILLEEDDKETISAIHEYSLPAHFKLVIVPDGTPKGKPKACNYGLIHADGEYVVIFDAEDIPEPDQLKKAILAFRKADESVVCIQAKLNYYNRDQNLLTRWFTAEYSMWFDLLLPGLDADDVPIPLGGTSNHFPTAILQQLGAWDPHNVTEDADLGMRLYKVGWKTAVIDSTTYEEANSEVYNWIRQRSRWVKGYIQTYLVHMRHPFSLWRYIGTKAFFSFNMVVGGTFLSFLINPVYWGLTAIWYLTQWAMIQDLYPAFIFYIGGFGLYIGNFVFTYVNVAGCLRRGYYDMVRYALLTPIYWALMSVAAWKGLIQLFYKPSYWEKTTHGLYRGEALTSASTGWRDLLFRRSGGQ